MTDITNDGGQATETTDVTTETAAPTELQIAQAEWEAEKARILAKNAELIDLQKIAKANEAAAKTAAQAAADEAARKAGDIEAIEKSWSDRYNSETSALKSQLHTLTVTNEISRALSAGNVLPHAVEALTSLFSSRSYEIEDGVARTDGQTIAEMVTAYLSTDAGKHFVAAPKSVGTNAPASPTAPTDSHGFTEATFTYTEFAKLAQSDPDGAKALAKRFGKSFA